MNKNPPGDQNAIIVFSTTLVRKPHLEFPIIYWLDCPPIESVHRLVGASLRNTPYLFKFSPNYYKVSRKSQGWRNPNSIVVLLFLWGRLSIRDLQRLRPRLPSFANCFWPSRLPSCQIKTKNVQKIAQSCLVRLWSWWDPWDYDQGWWDQVSILSSLHGTPGVSYGQDPRTDRIK